MGVPFSILASHKSKTVLHSTETFAITKFNTSKVFMYKNLIFNLHRPTSAKSFCIKGFHQNSCMAVVHDLCCRKFSFQANVAMCCLRRLVAFDPRHKYFCLVQKSSWLARVTRLGYLVCLVIQICELKIWLNQFLAGKSHKLLNFPT